MPVPPSRITVTNGNDVIGPPGVTMPAAEAIAMPLTPLSSPT